ALKAIDAGKLVALDRAETIADGIRVRKIGELTFHYIDRYVDEIVLVDDEEISLAMIELMEMSKLVVEGAGAVGVAALLNNRDAAHAREITQLLAADGFEARLLGGPA